jgi:hypothetical protein
MFAVQGPDAARPSYIQHNIIGEKARRKETTRKTYAASGKWEVRGFESQ